ncbi:amino acid adenylation domain-containing protein [Dactylosporangium salmoneum]|uniref:Carrier domain-containing protein n=1 Tax=Dactylosporangium salmoneum TaxID=53361 RepID=A0ABP5SVV9_9ACTN
MRPFEESGLYTVVHNDRGDLSVWPEPPGPPLPSGWRPVGPAAPLEDCLATIEARPPARPASPGGPARDGATLVAMFAASVTAHGPSPAVSDAGGGLTYAELDARSAALAARLVARGVEAGDRVVVHLERGVDVVVAMLGILRAGAAYVAVDTSYPAARRDLMVARSGARLALVAPGWAGTLPAGCEAWAEAWAGDAPDAPARPVGPESAACVLFTSGTSGTAKAVVLEHAGLVNFATNAALPPLGPGDRMAQVSSVSFDAFHYEVWCSLAAGAEIVVLPPLRELVLLDLQRELRRRRVTAMLAPTMAVSQVVREDREAFAPLRVLATGGDVLPVAAAHDVLGGAFSGTFVNLYGPTEATTACTAQPLAGLAADAGSVPIGRPLDGTSVHLLDAGLEPVPDGEPGELHIGGVGVARGYLDSPAVTARRFRPDPWGAPGGRMYATGDLARRRPDGALEFVGRVDDQVKIRGYRVDPGEVEQLLCRHPDVREAAVVADGTGTDKLLIAFVVPHETIVLKDLRAFAAAQVPEFMVPATFVVLGEIPANDHGKRDPERLHELVAEQRQRSDAYAEPQTATERYLASLWEELLATERVGTGDEFFALGGHSLLAFRAQRRIKRELGVELEFRDLLDNSVLGDLAKIIDARAAAGAGQD